MLKWLRAGPDAKGIEKIHSQFLGMLSDGRHIFDAAANSLIGGTDPEVIRADLFKTDERINLTEQRIRREIVIHGSVYGAASFPALLVVMSLVKDAERIGDYAKNLFDMAVLRPDLGDADERRKLVELKDTVSKLLVRAHGLFEHQREAPAQAYLNECDDVQDHCDAEVDRLLVVQGRNAAGQVLAVRYFKRVASHAGNIVTSLVMPVDKLDFYPGKPQSEQ